MKNYEYIIASLPVLSRDLASGEKPDCDAIVGDVRDLLSPSDNRLVDTLLEGFDPESLTREFYTGAAKSRSRFIREYFAFDLCLRNEKVKYLNSSLGRPAEQDVMVLDEDGEEPLEAPEELPRIASTLALTDILARERGLDDILWDKIDSIVTFNYFDMDAILAVLTKLRIIRRWLNLDEEQGRALFSRLVQEVKSTFGGVKYDPAK